MATSLKIIIVSSNMALKELIRQHLVAVDTHRQVLFLEGGLEALVATVPQVRPDVVIIEGSCNAVGELKVMEQLSTRYPTMALIVLCENASSEFLMGAIRSGVKDVLHLPLVLDELQVAITRVASKLQQAATPVKRGKSIAVIASKGGSGATFITCNLAYILAAVHGVKVALLDLNLQFGDAALFVSDTLPANTLADVASNISRLDASLLASSMVQVLPNFGVLAAPEDAESSIEIRPDHIEALLKLTRTQYDYVMMDVGQTLNATSVKALDYADMIFVVLQESMPFIRDSKRLINALQSLGYGKDKIYLIINRYEKGGDIRLVDVESTLGMKVFKTIPNSYDAVSSSVNQGIPIIKIDKNDSVTKAIQEIAKTLTAETSSKKSGWLDHLLHPV
ncbi:AAA family ATPase [Methylotenera sp.]|jgi:pilus assembly protein CpaE|uniref:AAA family ATPase n=1 Tax=Methylotenera sp. TaxID=2051956 RepID=UPI0027325937|nr:AAA family ATPase [Methylotenera sp.]MDP3210463.1 AAA family ATPase [Methylotenera sp.]